MLLRETFPAGAFQCNCTVLADLDTRDALVIDPGGDADRIAAILQRHRLTVRAIVHTHAHLDHIYATREVKQQHGGEIGLHADDLPLYDGFAMQAALFGWQPHTPLPVDRLLVDGDELVFGGARVRVLHTPGHTPGSICFAVDAPDSDNTNAAPLLFSGDTLFRRGIGRTDLWGGDARAIVRSIRERLYTLAPNSTVIPGHGPETTIADEAQQNPHVRAA
ncbi:MAG: MBL fold metallo-hydrolase [Myxococcales bacterium]|nr:MBL fold metallo-hydrolase [Myxococcales bacterium]